MGPQLNQDTQNDKKVGPISLMLSKGLGSNNHIDLHLRIPMAIHKYQHRFHKCILQFRALRLNPVYLTGPAREDSEDLDKDEKQRRQKLDTKERKREKRHLPKSPSKSLCAILSGNSYF